jgi:L-asparaginase II
MTASSYLPIFELIRGSTGESIHFGAVAVVDARGNLLASYGDPYQVTFLRSTAKPFQLLPLMEQGGQAFFNFTPREVALMCASHAGTDEHVSLVRTIQSKTGVSEADLLCGVHYPFHEPTTEGMKERKEHPTPNRHNCSGKHTGMLAFVRMREATDQPEATDRPEAPAEPGALHQPEPENPSGEEAQPYIDPHHPLQQTILHTFAEMARIAPEEIGLGIDGCSAPNFAVPLYNTALAFARLCDPEAGEVQPPARASACRAITSAMMFNPDMVAGAGLFDTELMEVGRGTLVAKGGAEGYQGIGLLPGAMGANSPGVGIAFKIADGDLRAKIRSAVAMEILRQLQVFRPAQLGLLNQFGPILSILNWRKLEVGQGRPIFQLTRHSTP